MVQRADDGRSSPRLHLRVLRRDRRRAVLELLVVELVLVLELLVLELVLVVLVFLERVTWPGIVQVEPGGQRP